MSNYVLSCVGLKSQIGKRLKLQQHLWKWSRKKTVFLKRQKQNHDIREDILVLVSKVKANLIQLKSHFVENNVFWNSYMNLDIFLFLNQLWNELDQFWHRINPTQCKLLFTITLWFPIINVKTYQYYPITS